MKGKLRTTQELIAEKMKDPVFARYYQAVQIVNQAMDALVEARKESGISQIELAAMLRTTQSAISRSENWPETVSLDRYVAIALACGYVPRIVLEKK